MDEYGRTKYYALMDSIKQDILDRTIKVGEKLPSENELARQYQVSRQTVRKALGILSEEGYVVSERGRGTFCSERMYYNRKTKNILCLLSEERELGNHSLLSGMELVFHEVGYQVSIRNTYNDSKEEMKLIKEALDEEVAGFIIEPSRGQIICPHQHLYEALDKYRVPYVFIQGNYAGMKQRRCILKNESQGSYLSTRYLMKQGHKKIVGIFSSDHYHGVEQHRGYVKALQEAGMSYHPEWVIWFHQEDRREKPYIMIEYLLKEEEIDAIVCQNDKIARKMIQKLEELGKKIPNDISVIANDVVEGKVKYLTSIVYHENQMGEEAARMLLHEIERQKEVEKEVFIQPKLLIGDTTRNRG